MASVLLQVFFTDKYKDQYPNYSKLTAELKEQMATLVSLRGWLCHMLH